MKKSLLALFLAICMAVMFVGCANGDTSPTQQPQQSTQPQETQPTFVNVTLNALSYNGIMYEFTLKVEEDSNALDKRTSSITFTAKPGETVLELMSAQGYTELTPVELHDEFVGWMEYKVIPGENKDGVPIATYEKISGDTYYTTQQVMEMAAPEYSVAFVAKWKNIEDSYYQAYGY